MADYSKLANINGDSVKNPRISGEDLIVDEVEGDGTVIRTVNVGRVKGRDGLPGMDAVESDIAMAAYLLAPDSESHAAVAQVTGGGRIVRVPVGEALPALLDGDLVVRYEPLGNIYYKDFADDVVDGTPVGLTNLMGSGMTVKLVTGGTGGKAFQAGASSSGVALYAITDSLYDPYLHTVEILSRWRHADSHGLSAFFNIDASADTYDRASYNQSGSTSRARVTVRRDGTNVAAPEATIPTIPATTWCMTRARFADGVTYVKHWVEGDAEPEWQFSHSDSTASVGPAGVGTGGGFTFDLDWFVVATGGKIAVKP